MALRSPMEVPLVQNQMVGGVENLSGEELLNGTGFLLQQKTSECCRFCCCQPNIHWRVHPYNEHWQVGQEGPTLMSISEEASRCGRTCSFCMPGHRATKYTVRAGLYDEENPGTQSNRVLYTHEKDTTCGTNVFIAFTDGGQLRIPMCCNLPYLETKDANGAKLGRTQYICDACLFVPKFHISNRNGETKYLLRPDTCVAGCCVKCKCNCDANSGKCCRVPFYIRDPNTRDPLGEGHITDLFAGWKRECCTKRNQYSIKYPPACDNEMRATLMGSALLVDITVFEQEQD